ncbi:unnamed protein product [Caenorhabditis angaria]|uniref:Uncharacterized protein n=1 Tax=Caenorhabditis angaria TaxID=860376 RepID=A0A9P1IC20_9PELO|nr:unnamed protein product [Caenorhabditis angaria]
MFRLFVTLLILAAAVDATKHPKVTKITADLGFKCRLAPKIRIFAVSFVEKHRNGLSHTLLRNKPDSMYSATQRKKFEIEFAGNIGRSKIYVHVKHNCTPSGRFITSRYPFVDLPIREAHKTIRATLILQQ